MQIAVTVQVISAVGPENPVIAVIAMDVVLAVLGLGLILVVGEQLVVAVATIDVVDLSDASNDLIVTALAIDVCRSLTTCAIVHHRAVTDSDQVVAIDFT